MDQDRPTRISRRAAMRAWIGRTAPLLLLAAVGRPAATALGDLTSRPVAAAPAAQSGPGPAAPSCVVTPQQTEGPYFVDERLERSDIRSDPSDGTLVEGVPLRLDLQVSQVSGAVCTPLVGAFVDLWQCDALGNYSDERDLGGRFDTTGKKFLRGYQVTDANGAVRFTTIYPGWYQGRTVHVHFKVRTAPDSRSGYEFTSQFYFDDAITDLVHAQAPYAQKGQRTVRNAQDGIFRSGGTELMLPLTPDGPGYAATFNIGLRMG